MVKLADTLDLGSNAVRCAGSSPVIRTSKFKTMTHISYKTYAIIDQSLSVKIEAPRRKSKHYTLQC